MTSSSGNLAGTHAEIRIEGPEGLAALRQGGAYWWEPDGSYVSLPVQETRYIDATGGSGTGSARTLFFPAGSTWYERPSVPSQCEADADCHIGGCSTEVCSAVKDFRPDCRTELALPWIPAQRGGACGCVDGRCRWYHAETADLPGQGAACDEYNMCADHGLHCLRFREGGAAFGVIRTACEMSCSQDTECPAQQHCVLMADGRGRVCRR